jgi:hypothetical protein
LTARAGTSSAAATLQVVVQPGPSLSPLPSGSPSLSPSPSVTPTPTSSPSPSPSSSPALSPSLSATPVAVSCGQPVAAAGNCAVTIVPLDDRLRIEIVDGTTWFCASC